MTYPTPTDLSTPEAYQIIRQWAAPVVEATQDDSGKHCLVEAEDLLSHTDGPVISIAWILRALEYSVGAFHPGTKALGQALAVSSHPMAPAWARLYGAAK